MRRGDGRGATLVEMLTGLAILLVAVAAAGSIAVSGAQLTQRSAVAAETNDASRIALGFIERDLRLAGFGAPGGLFVDGGAGARRINTVFGAGGGENAADELWLVVPEQAVLGDPAREEGAAVAVTRAGTGVLEVLDVGEAFDSGDVLMVSNMTTGALLTQTVVDPTARPQTVSYREMGLSDFSNAPHQGGFQIGDRAFRVRIVRYYVDSYLRAGEETPRPALFRATGSLRRQPLGAPFVEDAGSRWMVADEVEDLQIAFGRGEAPDLTYSNALEPEFVPDLRSVRVSLVARSRNAVRDGDGNLASYGPLQVEDRTPVPGNDGRRRSLYTRRVELSNLDPVNL